MKNLSRKFFAAFVLTLIIFSSANFGEAAKKIVAVMPIENISTYKAANVAEIMTEQLIVTITNSGQYTAVERTQMANVLREQGFEILTSNSANSADAEGTARERGLDSSPPLIIQLSEKLQWLRQMLMKHAL